MRFAAPRLLLACFALLTLVLACCVPPVTPVNPATTWGPLVVIFGVTLVKEGFDDLKRRRADAAANSRIYTVVRDGGTKRVQAQAIHVGDIVQLFENEEVPCDMVILSSSEASGTAYVQTTNLDGETNLKFRMAHAPTQGRDIEGLSHYRGFVRCPAPDEHLDRFDAQIGADVHVDSEPPYPLTPRNLLLQATHLRNTASVLALVVYTGNETKFGMNKRSPPLKWTRTDRLVNAFSALIFGFQLLLVVVFGILGDTWKATHGSSYDMVLAYKVDPNNSAWYELLIIPARFLLLNSTMIPISLKVTLDLVKLFYARFIDFDLALFDAEAGVGAQANSTALSEDLGQVQYIVTDKTGTLTKNEMRLVGVSVGGDVYGQSPYSDRTGSSASSRMSSASSIRSAGGAAGALTADGLPRGHRLLSEEEEAAAAAESRDSITALGLGDSEFPLLQSNPTAPPMPDRALASRVKSDVGEGRMNSGTVEFVRCMALCNTCVPRMDSKGRMTYRASSPDEEALVKSAAQHGLSLINRNGANVAVTVAALRESYEELACLEFSSERKRMSVLVRNVETGDIVLYSKGADEVMRDRVERRAAGSMVWRQVDAYAQSGHRTLVLASRAVSAREYTTWSAALQRASAAMEDRDRLKGIVYDEMEQNLQLLGATAVEDRLQDGVPQTIRLLRRAGVRFWMATGDKFNTALTIARTCRLMTRDSELVKVEGSDVAAVQDVVRSHIRRLSEIGVPGLGQPERPKFWERTRERCGDNVRTRNIEIRRLPSLGIDRSVIRPSNRTALVGRTDSVDTEATDASTEAPRFTVIMRGDALQLAQQDDVLMGDIARLCRAAQSVVFCRVTPRQKSLLVNMIREDGKLVLAVGDGGNDVAMIQEAEVGVGLRGKEGLQAARAADYQIGQFSALHRLILVHGRYSYHRSCLVALYSFYKSFLFCFLQIGYTFVSGYAGTSYFNSLCVAAYNAVLFVPIVFFCIDKDLSEAAIYKYPDAYKITMEGTYMTFGTLAAWFLRALVQAAIMLVLSFQFAPESEDEAYSALGLVVFSAYMWLQDVTMLLSLKTITFRNIGVTLGVHLLSYTAAWLMNCHVAFEGFIDFGSLSYVLADEGAWLAQLLMVVACVVPVEFMRSYSTWMGKSDSLTLLLSDVVSAKYGPLRRGSSATGASPSSEPRV